MSQTEFITTISWQPDNPDNEDANHDNPLEGKFTRGEVRTGGEWGDYPILFIEKDDGSEVAVHAFRTVLLNELTSTAPKIGERVQLFYGGTQKPKGSGKPYHVYKVKVIGREGGSFNWGRFGGTDDFMPEPAPEQPSSQLQDGDDLPF